MNFNIKSDLKLIREFFNLTQEELALELGFERLRIARIESGDITPRIEFLDKFYSYCFDKGLKLNIQKSMFYKDDIDRDHILLFHSSRNEILGDIDTNHNIGTNDFGNGFYCGDSFENVTSFSSKYPNSCTYIIDFDPLSLKYVRFNVDLEWVFLIAYYRGKLNKYKDNKIVIDLINKMKDVDYVIAPIADNRMFETIDLFINNEITDEECRHSLSATSLGLQYVFLNNNACKHLKIIEKCFVSSSEKNYYNNKQKKLQKEGLDKNTISKIKYKNMGKYLEELLNENN